MSARGDQNPGQQHLRLVIVVGCQRSGTTLMGQVIGAHSSAVLADETDDLYQRLEAIFKATDKSDLIGDLCSAAMSKYRALGSQDVHSKELLVLQAPNLTWSHVEIAENFPDASIVYMLRDPRAVVASMKNLSKISFVRNQIRFFRKAGFIEESFPHEWEQLMDADVCEEVKMALIAKIKMSLANNFRAVGLPVLEVKYEDLISQPRATLDRIFSHLIVPPDENCLGHDQVFSGFGPGGTDRKRGIDTHSLSKWQQHLPPETERAIWAAVGDYYESRGYRRT